MRTHLDSETQSNISKIPDEKFVTWGRDGVWETNDGVYREKTTVTNGEEAVEAFEKYTSYFKHVLNSWERSSDTLVLVPCGSSKPIGSSTIHQKKVKAIEQGGLENADIVVVSEPCVVVPPEFRLSLAASNYDFPPEFTVKNEYSEVFKVFTDRLAKWLNKMDYNTIYPYLISGHQTKFEAAVSKMDSDPTIHNIPSASYNPSTDSYSGDRFKKQVEMTEKVKAVCSIKANKDITVQEEYTDFYTRQFEC